MLTGRQRVIVAACAAALVNGAPLGATTGTVAVTSTQSGVTPKYVGYNMGHYLPGSNTSAWVEFSGVNAFRVWAAANYYEPSNSDTFGDGITNVSQFDSRKAAVRANPENNGFIPWATYNDNFENRTQPGRNRVKLNHILGELHTRGITPTLNLTRTESYPYNGWDGRWEQWQHFYAMAYHAAKNYDVERYQMYNEPDQNNATITQGEWLDRLKVSSDAVRSAIADVNRDFGKTLVADMSAPTIKRGADSVSTWDTPGSQDWGKQALQTNRTDYAGRAVDYDIFNTYDLHRYGDSNPIEKYATDSQLLKTEIPQYNASGQMMPVTYTEYNRRSTAGFHNRPAESLDSPQMFTELAQINLLAMSEDVQGLYAFKFNQTLYDDGTPQKTGFYYVQESGVRDTTGATKGASVQRLFAKGFKGERPRLATGGTSLSTYDVATSFDADSGNYYLMGVNRHDSQGHNLTVDLRSWDVQPGTVITVEEVSEAHHGAVTRMVTVPESKQISLGSQPLQSVWLLTAPSGTPLGQVVLQPSDDARVRNSDGSSDSPYKTENYGDQNRARVGRTPDSARFDYATYLKFDTGGVAVDDVSRAILQLTGQSTTSTGGNPGSILFHVYALTSDAWDESAITWNNAPNLDDFDAKVTDVGTSAFPVGMLTFDNTFAEWGIDLTDFIKLNPDVFEDGALSFALVREERFSGDSDPSFSYVDLWTKESGLATSPKLLLSVVPEPGSACIIAGVGATLLLRRRRQA